METKYYELSFYVCLRLGRKKRGKNNKICKSSAGKKEKKIKGTMEFVLFNSDVSWSGDVRQVITCNKAILGVIYQSRNEFWPRVTGRLCKWPLDMSGWHSISNCKLFFFSFTVFVRRQVGQILHPNPNTEQIVKAAFAAGAGRKHSIKLLQWLSDSSLSPLETQPLVICLGSLKKMSWCSQAKPQGTFCSESPNHRIIWSFCLCVLRKGLGLKKKAEIQD